MSEHRTVLDWFFESSRWTVGKQFAAAAVVIVVAASGVGVAFGSNRSNSDAPVASASSASVPQTSVTVPPTSAMTLDTTTATPATESTTAAIDGSIDALELLVTIPIELEHRGGYARDLFAVWSDLDGDGCDTRAEVLIAESLTPVQLDPSGCGVIAGDWLSSYDGASITSAGELDVDHVVALKEAWDSGAWQWPAERRIAYGNDLTDPRTLVAVSASSNRVKGDKDPSNWLPTESGTVCSYLGDWISIKARWQLAMDESEWGRVKNQLRDRCPGMRIST